MLLCFLMKLMKKTLRLIKIYGFAYDLHVFQTSIKLRQFKTAIMALRSTYIECYRNNTTIK